MKTPFLLLLLFLLPLPLLASEPPAFLMHNSNLMIRLRVAAPVLGISVNLEKGMIGAHGAGSGFDLKRLAREGQQPSGNPKMAIFPAYPGTIYISQHTLELFYHKIVYWDDVAKEVVLFNPYNGRSLILESGMTPQLEPLAQSDIPGLPKSTPWDIEKLERILADHPQMLKKTEDRLLKYAAANGDVSALKFLLAAGVPVNLPQNNNGYESALYQTIEYRHPEAATFMLENGANANELVYDNSLLLLATTEGQEEIVAALVKYNANVELPDRQGNTPLIMAAQQLNLHIVKLLVENGATLETRNEKGKTPLLAAMDVQASFFSSDMRLLVPSETIHPVVEYLLSKGADPHAVDDEGNSAFTFSAKLIDSILYQTILASLQPDREQATKLLLTLLASAHDLQDQQQLHKQLNAILDEAPEADRSELLAIEKRLKAKAEADLPAIFNDLLQRGADVNAINGNDSSLSLAIALEDLTFAKKLIDAGADVNAANHPLVAAVDALNPAGVSFLLERGADVRVGEISLFNRLDRKPLSGHDDPEQKAEEHDAIIAITRLLIQYHADMTIANDGGDGTGWKGQALHHAAYVGYPDQIALLLDAGADLEAGDQDGTTPLGIAAEAGELAAVQVLIKHGANLNAMDRDGNSIAFYAIVSKNIEVIKYILNSGAKTNNVNKNGKNLLMLIANNEGKEHISYYKGISPTDEEEQAYEKFVPDLAATFIKEGCKVNDTDNKGWTALHAAAFSGRVELAKVLINAGGKVIARDNNGNTPLHYAMLHDLPHIAELLIAHGANVNARNLQGLSPLDVANREGAQLAAKVLLKHGAKAWKFKSMRK